MSNANSSLKQENERQYQVVDQLISMHSLLRHKMERRAFWLNTSLIASSLFLAVFSFVGDDMLQALGLTPVLTRFILGLAAVVVLVFSITEFRVDWSSVASRHAEAVTRLAALKAEYRKSFAATGGDDAKENTRLTAEYDKTMSYLPPIPDAWFNRLKVEHAFKRMLSQRISQLPKTPIWFLRLQLSFEGVREAVRGAKEGHDGSAGR